jgi:hypothetical protein
VLIVEYGNKFKIRVVPLGPIDWLKTTGLGFGILIWHFVIFHGKNFYYFCVSVMRPARYYNETGFDPMDWDNWKERK